MDNTEVRSILSVYRPGEPGPQDPRFEAANRRAEADPELAQWWMEEQETDRIISSKVQSTTLPAGLKERLSSSRELRSVPRRNWSRPILLLAACIVVLAVFFSSWRGPFQPSVSLADYRDEMVAFIKVDPTLELETKQLARVSSFLTKTGAPSRFEIPKKLQEMEPVGCRTLRFRGQDVALICFRREEGGLVHLFVVDRKAFPQLRSGSSSPHYEAEGKWMTAAWVEGDQAYLIMAQGDHALLEKYLSTS